MNTPDIDVLGLPKSFNSDSDLRREELRRALDIGYNQIKTKYGKFAATNWEKTPDSVILADTTQEFVNLVCEQDPEHEASLRKGFAENSPHAWTAYPTNRVVIDSSSLSTPLLAAEIMAHETVHAWAGRNPLKFRHIIPQQLEGRQDILNHLEDRANEGLVDFVAMEGLGLLNPPITRLESLDMLIKAKNALVVRELAKGLGKDVEQKIVRMTQGTFQPKEADWTDGKIGPSPLSRIRTSYIEQGFLFTVAGLNSFAINSPFQPGELEKNISDTLAWYANARSRGNVNLEFLGRNDFASAQEQIRKLQLS